MIGQTISHYKILSKLGEGGMGVVYRAHDTTLERDVALKFLPNEYTDSSEERSRFLHEAKAASALDHPNICTIHEAGQSPDGRMFIAMGYYEGLTLSKKIEKGRLAVGEAVSIAIQIADGLHAAHAKGIVHRDIKSSNVLITRNSQVKILDFGLAHRTGLSKLTRTGTTVGTAAYMSPEQARGEKLDARSDLWSLGVVLYEMVTGKLPFRGEHEAAILYSVVNEQPQPIEVIVPEASLELIHIIRRALEKEPSDRYQSASDMLIDLRRLKKDTSRSGFAPVSGTKKKIPLLKNTVIVAAVSILLLVLAGYFYFMKTGIVINPDWKQHQVELDITDVVYPGISGDGNWIAFSGRDRKGSWGIYLMNLKAGGPRLITSIQAPSWVDLSKDGSMLLYFVLNVQTNRWDWYTVYSNGGEPKKIIHTGHGPRFLPDGKRVGYILGSFPVQNPSPSGKLELWTVGLDGNDPRREFIDSVSMTEGVSCSFSYSPDGKKVAWLRTFPEKYQEIVIHDIESGQENIITSDRKTIDELVWVREESIIYTTDKNGMFNVWMVSAKGGEPVQITKGAQPALGIKSSEDGEKMVYTLAKTTSELWIVNVAENRSRQIAAGEDAKFNPRFSPDAKKIAFAVGENYGPSHIFVMDREGGNRRQLSFGEEVASEPRWSTDGRRIAFRSRKISETEDSNRTYVIDLSNPGAVQYVTNGIPIRWRDSARIQIKIGSTVYFTSLDGVRREKVFDDSTEATAIQGGKYILFTDYRKGKDNGWWIVDGLKPREVQQKSARLLLQTDSPFKLDEDGRFLYSIRKPGELWRTSLPDGKEERVPADFLGVQFYTNFNPSWDGKEIIITKPRPLTSVVIIENLFK